MKKRLFAAALALLSLLTVSMTLISCDESSGTTTYNNKSTKDNKDYGGYTKEYWDAARDAWDANT
ncbi:MAG: hypothetical protein J6K77_07975 [Ruminococcus sp.]|nr:hypothetical protein [Ruminococcus sp.]